MDLLTKKDVENPNAVSQSKELCSRNAQLSNQHKQNSRWESA